MSVPTLGAFEIIRGQAVDIDVTVPDSVDLTGATAECGFAPSASTAYVLEPTATISGQVVSATLSGADTAALGNSSYYYSFWVVISGAPTPVARGKMTVTDDARNR